MEREVKKLKATDSDAPLDLADPDAAANHAASIRKLETYLEIAKGEINRLDYIISQFLQAIRPTRPELKPVSLNDILLDTVTLLGRKLKTVRSRCRSTSPRSAQRAAGRSASETGTGESHQERHPGHDSGGALTLTTIAETDGVWFTWPILAAVFRRRKSTASFSPFHHQERRQWPGPNDCSAYCANTVVALSWRATPARAPPSVSGSRSPNNNPCA